MPLSDYLSHPSAVPRIQYTADEVIEVTPDTGLSAAMKDLARLREQFPMRSVLLSLAPGEYRTDGLYFSPTLFGNGNAPVYIVGKTDKSGKRPVINGGIRLTAEDFHSVPEPVRRRLHGEAAERVVCADLTAYGLSSKDWGGICAVGGFHTADKYDDGAVGVSAEVFCNGHRMTLARYPGEGKYLRIDAVADVGDCWEFPPQNYDFSWPERRNHRGGCYVINPTDNARVSSWDNPEDVWAFGYFFWDWADGSTPVRLDPGCRRFFPKYVSRYGAKAGAEFYFFNILEELDEPGEYYLDRRNGILYLYPEGEMKDARIEISLSTSPALLIESGANITVDGIDFCNIRQDGIRVSGHDITLRNLHIFNAAENGISANGTRIRIDSCEISHTGRGGIVLSGGDRPTLTRGDCEITNNYIHHFAEIYRTYAGGIHIDGVGNRAAHNEICYTPHTAIFYYGNDHLIEYNYIHDAVLHSKDAGAIYSGQDWSAQGSVVRYNALERIGSESLSPEGIYWDDGLSGQTAYGNVLVGIGSKGFLAGGGFDNRFYHNLLIDTEFPLFLDDRNREGLLHSGWCHQAVDSKNGENWKRLYAMPFDSDIWKMHYPVFAKLRTDLENTDAWDDPYFPTNPARCEVYGNVSVAIRPCSHRICPSYALYSRVEQNPVFEDPAVCGFADFANGDYRFASEGDALKVVPNFPDIPFRKIGRE